ncbi:hypothetical protein [Kibdelosporangium phytohabitans]|uniref:Uncharacterized protein n=1 Tax=Kibdelosporangium phytohabitans TaxID=860235 RepID=A0A0N9HR19_9PSEU|nr:hypothetical protein [Kibdelosporangium phytohabitans]ALG07269.1 hypothetical protein AOZ06_10355 [Kibdelosporangium phytohabitans]MBE1471870.1 hypothetical protein [Kibdelosporangium phytohabitans]
MEGSLSDYFDERGKVTVVADQTATVRAKLAPAATIVATVRDAATKAPVANACVYPKTGHGTFGEGPLDCAGADGRVEVNRVVPGEYQLWAEAKDGVHGAQWVGANGGTGSRLTAKTHKAVARETTAVSVLLDRAGSITGTVTDKATGKPVAGVCAFPRGGHRYDVLPPSKPNRTKEDGRYALDGLGPYRWPVHFIDNVGSHGWQWSGDQPSQSAAGHVRVHVGQTSTADALLVPGKTISGNVKTNGVQGDVGVYNAITGDIVAYYTFPDDKGDYKFTNVAAGHQLVKIVYTDHAKPPYHEYWYKNASSFPAARPILIRPGGPATGADFVVTPR